MSPNNDKIEAINVRTTRINHLILGRSEATSKVSRPVAEALSREGLLDALCLLYNECNKDFLKKNDRNIFDFVTKCKFACNSRRRALLLFSRFRFFFVVVG